MAFVRLWYDPVANPSSRIRGKWYVEPVYFADIPALKAGTHTPRYCVRGIARVNWPNVPESAISGGSLILFRGDVLRVGDSLARYWTMNIALCALNFNDVRTGEPVSGFPQVSKWGNRSEVKVVHEDCLGRCYDGLVLSS